MTGKNKKRRHNRFRNLIAKALNELRFGPFRPKVYEDKKRKRRSDRKQERREIREQLSSE